MQKNAQSSFGSGPPLRFSEDLRVSFFYLFVYSLWHRKIVILRNFMCFCLLCMHRFPSFSSFSVSSLWPFTYCKIAEVFFGLICPFTIVLYFIFDKCCWQMFKFLTIKHLFTYLFIYLNIPNPTQQMRSKKALSIGHWIKLRSKIDYFWNLNFF